MRRSLWFAIAAPLVLAACGSQDATTPGSSSAAESTPTTSPASDDTVYTGSGTVLENADHGPQLCLGAITASYPPQCGGPDIAGWSWDGLGGSESVDGITWGVYVVAGTYDGTTFTLTAPPQPAMYTTPIPPDMPPAPDFTTPCTPPEGGWPAVDMEQAKQDVLTAAMEYAQAQPDYAGSWVDQGDTALVDRPPDPAATIAPEATGRSVLNFRFTGDLERHETELKKLWTGGMCVSQAEHSERDLTAIQKELESEPGVLGSYTDVSANVLNVEVVVKRDLQIRLDEKYGAGVVRVYAALQPVTP